MPIRRRDGSVDPAENAFPHTHPVAAADPHVPWAMFLAGVDGAYRFLVFDFDAHSLPIAHARADTDAFTTLLEHVGGLPFVECESSPGRGFHIWIALAEPLPAPVAGLLADVAKRLYPTLDKGPLNGAGTGAARSPGAPHRLGGVSRVLRGTTASLMAPSATRDDIDRLAIALEAIAPPPPPESFDRTNGAALVLIDVDGHPHLPGLRRELGALAAAALTTPLDRSSDASAVMYSILLGAARARWRYSDVEALLVDAPGLEHARSERAGTRRVSRPPKTAAGILSRQWDKAVRRVSTTRLSIATQDSPDTPPRVALMTNIVQQAQARADASPGAWTHTPGLSAGAGRHRAIDRAVLDELHRRSLIALTVDVGVSVRTLSMALTVGRESVRQALHRLAAHGWITLVHSAEATAAATWSVDPTHVFHREAVQTWSAMGGTTPHRIYALEAARQRADLLAQMSGAHDNAHHDVFVPRALGPQAGRVYAALQSTGPADSHTLASAAHVPLDVIHAVLEQLQEASLAVCRGKTWTAAHADQRETVAAILGVTGVLAERHYRYRLEQATWAYWQEELAMTSRATALVHGHVRTIRLAGEEPIALGPYPRQYGSRADHREARDLIERLRAA